MQVSLFKRFLLMVRNLRVESEQMHAFPCICRTSLCVDTSVYLLIATMHQLIGMLSFIIFKHCNPFSNDFMMYVQLLSNMIAKVNRLYHNHSVVNAYHADLPALKKVLLTEPKVHDLFKYGHEACWITSPSAINITRQSTTFTCQVL